MGKSHKLKHVFYALIIEAGFTLEEVENAMQKIKSDLANDYTKEEFDKFEMYKKFIKIYLNFLKNEYNNMNIIELKETVFPRKRKLYTYIVDEYKLNVKSENTRKIVLKLVENELKISWKYQAYLQMLNRYLCFKFKGISKIDLFNYAINSYYSKDEAEFAIKKLEKEMKPNWKEECYNALIFTATNEDDFWASIKYGKEEMPAINIYDKRNNKLKKILSSKGFTEEEIDYAINKIPENKTNFWNEIITSRVCNKLKKNCITEIIKDNDNLILLVKKLFGTLNGNLTEEELAYVKKYLEQLCKIDISE